MLLIGCERFLIDPDVLPAVDGAEVHARRLEDDGELGVSGVVLRFRDAIGRAAYLVAIATPIVDWILCFDIREDDILVRHCLAGDGHAKSVNGHCLRRQGDWSVKMQIRGSGHCV